MLEANYSWSQIASFARVQCQGKVTNNLELATTAIEETWPRTGPILFAGSWCLTSGGMGRLEGRDFAVHHDQNHERTKDFQVLQQIESELLPDLASQLNAIHGVEYSTRYWKILLGWWLTTFISVFCDRWRTLESVTEKLEKKKLLRLAPAARIPASPTTLHFLDSIRNDPWNERLLADMAEEYFGFSTDVVAKTPVNERSEKQRAGTPRMHVDDLGPTRQTRLCSLYRKVLGRINQSVHFESVYMSRNSLRLTELFLGQLPVPRVRRNIPLEEPLDEYRCWSLGSHPSTPLRRALQEAIVRYLPTFALEGYALARDASGSAGFPQRSDILVTSIAQYANEVWKFWAADQVESGSKLIIVQHGGTYGSAARSAAQVFETDIADQFLTWGWRDPLQAHVQPFYCLKPSPRLGWACGARTELLQILTNRPRYFVGTTTAPIGDQVDRYFEEQVQFISALRSDIREHIRVRHYPSDFGRDLNSFKKRIPSQVNHDDGTTPIEQLMKKAHLVVATSNGTSFLETFAADIPTVVFWNTDDWKLNEPAISAFRELEFAGVFWSNPDECARHVNDIWGDVDAWWHSREVRHALKRFRYTYTHKVRMPSVRLASLLRAEVKSKNEIRH